MSEDWVGRTVDHYRIVAKLGQGGSGQVFRALDLTLNREVAIKVLRPDLATDPAVAERFRNEARTLARLNHPHIATLYRLLWEEEVRGMVMEYVVGETLDELVRRHGPLAADRVLPLFVQALQGIQHAHEHGVIHRDVKGSNVMRGAGGLVKVMDFGIARALGSTGLTQEGRPVGTPEYMAPEQVRGEELDARTDIYALGVLLFKLLCGRVPFPGRNPFDVMRAHVEAAPPRPSELVPGLPSDLEEVVLRALAKYPEERFAGVPELVAALEEAVPALRDRRGFQAASEPSDWEVTPSGVLDDAGTLDSDTTEVPAEETPAGAEVTATSFEAADAEPLGERPTRILPDQDVEAGAPVPSPGAERRRRVLRWAAAAAGLAVGVLVAAAFWIPRGVQVEVRTAIPRERPELRANAPKPAPVPEPAEPEARADEPPVSDEPAPEETPRTADAKPAPPPPPPRSPRRAEPERREAIESTPPAAPAPEVDGWVIRRR